jgi:hypothetical protein
VEACKVGEGGLGVNLRVYDAGSSASIFKASAWTCAGDTAVTALSLNVVLPGHLEVTVMRILPGMCAGISNRSGPNVAAAYWWVNDVGKTPLPDGDVVAKRSGSPSMTSKSSCTAGGEIAPPPRRSSGCSHVLPVAASR